MPPAISGFARLSGALLDDLVATRLSAQRELVAIGSPSGITPATRCAVLSDLVSGRHSSPTWLASIGFGSALSKLGGSVLPELLKQFTVDGASL